MKCKIAIPFNGLAFHAYEGSVDMWDWNPSSQEYKKAPSYKHNYPPILKPTKKQRLPGVKGQKMPAEQIEGTIIKELTEILGRVPTPVVRHETQGDERRLSWIKRLKLHSDQVGPIDGLTVYEHGLKCITGSCVDAREPFFTTQTRSMGNHLSITHSSIAHNDRNYDKGFSIQTFSRVPGLAFFFEVPKPPKNHELLPTKYASLKEALRNERQELLRVTEGHGTIINPDLLHPAFGDIGFATFWEKLDMDMVKPLLAIVPTGSKRIPEETKLLQNAVMSTFLEICSHVKNASPGLRQLITKGAA
jgi:hypothetical protein